VLEQRNSQLLGLTALHYSTTPSLRFRMILLFDIGNTHTHLGLANGERVIKQINIPTAGWFKGAAEASARKFAGERAIQGAVLCSVVPRATSLIRVAVKRLWGLACLELTPKTLRGVGIDYPQPKSIGPDRLANAVAARHHFGAPVVVVDFGTAVTFDVVNRAGDYVGGIIAPGLSAMTDYLHEKTALLPRIRIREINKPIGKSTEQAMLVGAVHGYRGLIRELLMELKRELKTPHLPVVATGGYGRLIAARLPEITAVDPLLTLEALRLVWQANHRRNNSEN
jgi:type III pantothenate kinase